MVFRAAQTNGCSRISCAKNGVPSASSSRDCCDSISSIFFQHHYTATEAEAVAAAFEAGTQLCFECGEAQIAALNKSLADNSVKIEQLDSALGRLFLTRMRLGEFERGERRTQRSISLSSTARPIRIWCGRWLEPQLSWQSTGTELSRSALHYRLGT